MTAVAAMMPPLLLLLSCCWVEGQPAIPPWPASTFYEDITAAPVYPHSGKILNNMKLSAAAGSGAARGLAWGSTTGNLQTDTGIMPLRLPSGGKKICAAITGRATTAQPDCDDTTHLMFPLPEGGAIESTTGYGACKGDCHLLVHDEEHELLCPGPPGVFKRP